MSSSSAFSKIPTGLTGLDQLLDGGFPEGKVILVIGEPGTGKTILASQFLLRSLKDKERSVFVGLNEPKERYIAEMSGLSLDFTPYEKDGSFSFIDATGIRRIPDQARVGRIPVGGKELGLVNLIDMVEEATEKTRPARIAIDSISDLVFRFPNLDERRPVILDLVDALHGTGATCLMTSEVASTGADRLLQPEEYLAEGVIQLRRLAKGVRSIEILKMRGSKIDTKPRPYVITDTGVEVLATEEIY